MKHTDHRNLTGSDRLQWLFQLLVVICAGACFGPDALGQNYIFTKIAEAPPQGPNAWAFHLGVGINESGDVVYQRWNNGANIVNKWSCLGGESMVASSASYGRNSQNDSFWGVSIDDGGTVSFPAHLQSGGSAVWTSADGTVATATSGMYPDGGIAPCAPVARPSAGGASMVAVAGKLAGQNRPGVYRYSGGVQTTIFAPAGSTSLATVGSINRLGRVAFTLATTNGNSTVMSGSSSSNLISIVQGGSAYVGLFPSMNDSGETVSWGSGTAGQFVWQGPEPGPAPRVNYGWAIAAVQTPYPIDGETVSFSVFGDPAINNSGLVVFNAILSDGVSKGIYSRDHFMYTNAPIRSVLKPGQKLDGWDVTALRTTGDCVNDKGQIVFFARLQHPTTGAVKDAIYRADPGAITFIDLNNDAFRNRQPEPGQNPTANPAYLVSGGNVVDGIAADGVTQVLIRVRLPDGSCLSPTYQLAVEDDSDPPSSDPMVVGKLRECTDPNPDSNANPVAVSVVGTGTQRYLMAVLTSPTDFARGPQDYSEASRELRIRIWPTGGARPDNAQTTIQLVRPPVVLLHGLHDKRSSWDWPLRYDRRDPPSLPPRFVVVVPDYQSSNGASFSQNLPMVRNKIRDLALAKVRSSQYRYAATQVDLVGHSMGGVLGRLFAMNIDPAGINSGLYLQPDNFSKGYIHKLITVDTPHTGSPGANLFVNLDGSLTATGVAAASITPTRDLNGGAVRDLRPDSAPIFAMNHWTPPPGYPIPAVHALYSSAGKDSPNPLNHYWLKSLAEVMTCYALTEAEVFANSYTVFDPVFGPGVGHDCVVDVESQRGGLSGTRTSQMFGERAYHGPIIDDGPRSRWPFPSLPPPYVPSDRVIELLNARADGASFQRGFPNAPPRPAPQPCLLTAATQGAIRVVLSNLTVEAGSTLMAAVEPLGGFVPVRTWILTSADEIHSADGPSHEAMVNVPLNSLADFGVTALAMNSQGQFATAAVEWSTVHTGAQLTGISLDEDSIVLASYWRRQRVSVVGHYDDGVDRELSPGSSGLSLFTANAQVASVDEDGSVIGRHIGATTLTASIGPFSAALPVTVSSAIGDSNGDGLVNATDLAAFNSCFSGPREAPGFVFPPLACRDVFDADGDGDIDCDDWGEFLAVWSGATCPSDSRGCTPDCNHDGVDDRCVAPSGLVGTYYADRNLSRRALQRVDSTINFNWGAGSPHALLAPDQFSIRWQGYILAPSTANYTFRASVDDGVRMWIGGQLVIDYWIDQVADRFATVSLVAGQRYPIVLEYYENGGGASISLSWAVGGPYSIVPSANLYHDPIDCNGNGIIDSCEVATGTAVDLDGNGILDSCEAPLFVKASATGLNDGTSWTNAYRDLQDALSAATSNPNVREIWVAAGTYKPDRGTGDRTRTFRPLNGVALYGGFVGTETLRDQRNFFQNIVVLSGDLLGNDGPGYSGMDDNAFNVIACDSVTSATIFDGFRIERGNAYGGGAAPGQSGGAATLNISAPTFANCTFFHNRARYGGAIMCWNSSSPRFTNCAFIGNRGEDVGGAVSVEFYGIPTFTNCLFSGNTTSGPGGAVRVYTAAPDFINCTFASNTGQAGGGLHYTNANVVSSLRNCLIWGNQDSGSSIEAAQLTEVCASPPCQRPLLTVCCLEGYAGGPSGSGNFGSDPVLTHRFGTDGVAGTLDDDLRLGSGSSCIDRGVNGAVPAGTVVDLLGQPRFVDDPNTLGVNVPPIIDLGAIEYQGETCIADVDDGSFTGTPDGGVTIDDLLYYFFVFEAGDLSADVDDGSFTGALDGGVTIDDLLYYLFRFEQGC